MTPGENAGSADPEADAPASPGRWSAWRLTAVFGLLSFLQGVIEPTEGLLAQPVRSTLLAWGRGAGEVARFAAVLSLPWALKPLLGLLTDLRFRGGPRRRDDVVAAGALAASSYIVLAILPGSGGTATGLLAGLLVASVAVALSDVATDALVVDRGRVDGRTGRYQAAQWFCLYASGIVTGTAGGALSAGGRTRPALLACAAASAVMLAVAAWVVREPIRTPTRTPGNGPGRSVWSADVRVVGGFLALSNFNPFASSALLHLHFTGVLGFSEQFFGHTISVLAAASMAGAAVYGVFGPALPLKGLAYGSVALGVVSNLVYLGVVGPRSALVVTIVVGFTAMTSTLIQLELAALACPPGAVGTVFATFMSVSTLSASLATWLGGAWYEGAGVSRGRASAFHDLVVAGSAFAAMGLPLVPLLPTRRAAAPDRDEALSPFD